MTIGNIPRTRLKFLDKETSLMPQDLSEITSNLPINDAQALFDSSLNKLPDLKKELASLSSPLGPVQQALNSGAAASEALADIQKTVQANLPDMRSVSASITAVTANTVTHAKNLSQSVVGQINQTFSGIPAAIGKVGQLSQNVKSEMLKSSVVGFVKQVGQVSKTVIDTGKTAISTVQTLHSSVQGTVNQLSQAGNQLSQTVSQFSVQRTVQASHQSLSSSMGPINLLANQPLPVSQSFSPQRTSTPVIGPTLSPLPPTNAFNPSLGSPTPQPLTTHQLQNQALAEQIQRALDDQPLSTLVPGTTSSLPPTTYADGRYVNAEPAPQILYSDHALRFMVTASSWFRSLSSWEYQSFSDILTLRYGTSRQLFGALSKDPTDLDKHQEQMQNTLQAFGASGPDESSKLLWMIRTFQETVQLSIPLLEQRSMTNELVGWLNQLIGALRLSTYLTTQGLEKHIQDRKELVHAVVENQYRIQTQSDSDRLIQDAYTQLVTRLLFYHRSNPELTGLRPSTPTRLAVVALLSLVRDLVNAGVETGVVRLALDALTRIPLESLRLAYSDSGGLVTKDHPVCWKPSVRASVELPIPLIRHYRSQKTNLLGSRDSLVNTQEKQFFDALITQMQILENASLAAFDAIWNHTHPYHYLSPTAVQQELAQALRLQMVEGKYHFQDTGHLPPYCFETYALDVEQLYVDDTTIVLL